MVELYIKFHFGRGGAWMTIVIVTICWRRYGANDHDVLVADGIKRCGPE